MLTVFEGNRKRARMRFAINGRFLTRQMTGVDRYAFEVVRHLDKLASEEDFVIVAPEEGELVSTPALSNIKLIRYGCNSGHKWEQRDFADFLEREDRNGINLCNTAPLKNPGIVCIHDMAIRAHPEFFDWKFRLLYRLLFRVFASRAARIITVSDFSKREMEKYYPASKGKISVIGNAWDHMKRVDPDFSVLSKAGLAKGEFWFAMSSLAPNKNLKWIARTAQLNPNDTFVVAGGINTKVFGKNDIPQADNVIYLGYVSDEEAKALLQSCKGFLFPTFYEGFGIPPMEAMSCGATAYVSDTDVMHEVYGDSVVYVDPHEPCENLNSLCSPLADSDTVLEKNSWEDSAEKLFALLVEEYGE